MLLRNFKLKEFVYHSPSQLYGIIDDVFHLEDIAKTDRHTVYPIYIVKVVSGELSGAKFASFHENLTLVGDLN